MQVVWWLQISRRGVGSYFRIPNMRLPRGGADWCGTNAVDASGILINRWRTETCRSQPGSSWLSQVDPDLQSITQDFPLVLEYLPWRTVVSSLYCSNLSQKAMKSCLHFLTALLLLVLGYLLSMWVHSGHSSFLLLWRNAENRTALVQFVYICKTVLIYLEKYTCIHFLMILKILFPKS